MNRNPDIQIIHIKQSSLTPLETFVVARVFNPVCRRPVPVLTHAIHPAFAKNPELRFYALQDLSPARQRLEHAVANRFHIYPYYLQTIHRLRPALIHAHFSGAGEACLPAARRLNIPLLVNFYGIETKYHLSNSHWLQRYQRLFRLADHFICSSQSMKTVMIAAGCPPEKISVIRCGIDTDLFNGQPAPWQPGEQLRLLCVARLHPEKGLGDLLQAGRLLNDAGFGNWQLEIIGWGPQENELKEQSATLGLGNQVRFLGIKTPPEIVAHLRAAHLFILPSLEETQGVVFQEAQATCTPVVATRIGGIPEGILDGETGILVPPRQPEAIRDAVLSMTGSPARFIEMGLAGRRYVLANFSRQDEYKRLNDLYQELVQKNRDKVRQA